MDFLYNVDQWDRYKIARAGLEWKGPQDRFPQSQDWTLVAAVYRDEGHDGQSVLIEECAMPARFFRLNVLAGPNSCGELQSGYILSTGSSDECHHALIGIAKHIAAGMIGLHLSSNQDIVAGVQPPSVADESDRTRTDVDFSERFTRVNTEVKP